MDTIYIVTLYEYEEDMGKFYFTTQEKADKFVADMSAGVDGEFYISHDSVDVPYETPDTVWFCVDESFRVTTAYFGAHDQTQHYDAEEGICYIEVAYRRNRGVMEELAIEGAKELLMERAR